MAARKRLERALWLAPIALPIALLGAGLAGVGIALAGPTSLLGWVLVAAGALPILWVLGSALWPASAERTCPACRRNRVQRLDPRTTHGLVCPDCGWRDETASSWLLAEEEGPLEDIVLAQRGRGQTPRPSPVDSSRDRG